MGLHLRSVLQPIVDTETGRVIGHEALLRGPRGTSFEDPGTLFAAAARLGLRDLLEANARWLAGSRLKDLPDDQKLFINVDALNRDMPPIPGRPNLPRERIALEISERQPILDNDVLLEQVARWRAMGHPIVIDDYGAGYMGLGALFALHPDILKIDQGVVTGIAADPVRQAAVEAVAHIARRAGFLLIAEGVETSDEFAVLKECGVRYMQGFLLGRPHDQPAPPLVRLPEFPNPASVLR